ncbi:hypothetical protein [Amycolatopsis sp. NBC_01480]|uniref:hypothetical protein n=1 Tax=Amycolatopsis sp. NBC_01480 TaxID=2903562 RepID=UPI002E2DD2A7|nr:hypothetical protein [Amycolatopsis sp. NBC_01480]
MQIRKIAQRAAALVVFSAAAALAVAAPAGAQGVATGTLAFSGDAGDYITGGGTYAYSIAANDRLSVTADEAGHHISVGLTGANGDWWSLDLAAPQGQTLAAGTYTDAHRYPFQAPQQPGLDLSGNGRGCNQSTDSFVVQNVLFGPHGYVQNLDATFEQHCENGATAARGEIHLANPAPPAELGIGLKVATDGTASTLNGKAGLNGSVECTAPATVTLNGSVTQVKHNVIIRGTYSVQVKCTPGAPVPWQVSVDPAGTTPYQKGQAEVVTQATALDPVYNTNVSVDNTTVVTLKKA